MFGSVLGRRFDSGHLHSNNMQRYKVSAWVGDCIVSKKLLASSNTEAEKMTEVSLKSNHPKEDIRIIGSCVVDTILRKLTDYE